MSDEKNDESQGRTETRRSTELKILLYEGFSIRHMKHGGKYVAIFYELCLIIFTK
jgi:hypothetical protein